MTRSTPVPKSTPDPCDLHPWRRAVVVVEADDGVLWWHCADCAPQEAVQPFVATESKESS